LSGFNTIDYDLWTIWQWLTILGHHVRTQVYTKEMHALIASISCVSCRDTDQFSVTNSQVIKLVGGCAGCRPLDTDYRWTVERHDGVRLPINLITTTTGANSRNLVVRSSAIEAGYAYRFTAQITIINN